MMTEMANLRSLFEAKGKKYFPDIGKATADKLLNSLTGDELVHILRDNRKEALISIPGISEVRALTLLQGYARYKSLVDVAIFLDQCNISLPIAVTVYTVWGPACLESIKRNPYRLLALTDWDVVDQLGLQRGPEFHPCRILAAILYCMYGDCENDQNTCITSDTLYIKVTDLIRCDHSQYDEGMRNARNTGAVIDHKGHLQVPAVYLFERRLEDFFAINKSTGISSTRVNAFINKDCYKRLTDEQKNAVVNANIYQKSVFTGRAGTGKTSTLAAIADTAEALLGKQVILSAVAAKACRKIEEETGRPACTIATLVHVKKQRDLANRLVIIDEASMLSLIDAYHVCTKLPESSNLVLLGDLNQIPSVGAGRILYDIINTKAIPHIELTINKRHDAKTDGQLSQVLCGEFPELDYYSNNEDTGLFRLMAGDTEDAEQLALELYLSFRNVGREAQIISPLRLYTGGSNSINAIVHRAIHKTHDFCIGTPVVWCKNRPVKSGIVLNNGSVGVVSSMGHMGYHLEVEFQLEGPVMLTLEEANKYLERSYCLTVHKSQGSEYDNVIILVPRSERMIDRNMLYTSLSRCRQRAIIIYDDHRFIERQVALPTAHLRRLSLFLSGR